MKKIFGVTLFVILASCSQEPIGTPRSVRTVTNGAKLFDELVQKFREQHFKHPIDALDWIKHHTKIRTTGIESHLFANELHIPPHVWGRWINDDHDLITVRLSRYRNKNGSTKATAHIFHVSFTPKDQIANALAKFPAEQFEQKGVPLEKIANNVHFKQPEWDDRGFHRAIGRYLLGMEEFVTYRLLGRTTIFRRGFTPKDQLTNALANFPDEQFQQKGVPLKKIADNVYFKQPEWDDHSFQQVIGQHLREIKEIVVIRTDKKRVIFRKGYTPKEQIAKAIEKFPAEQFKQQGVPFEKIADNVHFRQPGYNDLAFFISIGQHLDKSKFVTYRVEAESNLVIFRKGYTPKEQVAKAIEKFPAEQLRQQGVPLEKIANNVYFKQPEWDKRGFHRIISQYIDKDKFVVSREVEKKRIIYLRPIDS